MREIIFDDPSPVTEQPPEVVRFVIKNPLRQKKWGTLLVENEGAVRKEILRWWKGWLSRLVPLDIYRKSESKSQVQFSQAVKYLIDNGIRMDNPGGRSLERHVYHKGRLVGVFRIDISDTI